ncbi:MAG: Gfo/Idh/MocA family oxidoreductase [Chloroflexota bacterium]
MINIGIIGCGVIARTHIRALLRFPESARITALASRSSDSIQGAAAFLAQLATTAAADAMGAARAALTQQAQNVPAQFLDFHDLIASPGVDAVIITTPPSLHHPAALAALKAGKHVLCEKPLTTSLRHADELIAAASQGGAHLMTVSQGRYASEQRRMRALVQSGALGRVHSARADTQWYRPPNYYELWWRGTWAGEGGGALTGQGIHILDQLLWIMDRRPVEVFGRMDTFVHDVPRQRADARLPIEDTAFGLVTFEDGAIAEIAGAVSHQIERSQIELYGTLGAVKAFPWLTFSVDDAVNQDLERVAAGVRPLPPAWQSDPAEIDPYRRPGQNALPTWSMNPQIGDFLQAIITGAPGVTEAAEGRRALEVLAGFYKSAIGRQPVSLPLDQDDPYYDGVAVGAAGPA